MNKKNIVLFLILFKILLLFAQSNPVCNYCHKPISGDYIKVGENYFHPNHFKCAWCKKPIKTEKFMEYNGKYYHEKCFYKHIVPKCVICGKPIKGAYIKNYWGQIYHSYHENSIKKCEYCSRVIKNPYKDKNGFYVCNICKKKEIKKFDKANEILKKIMNILYKNDIKISPDIINLNLVTLDELKKISQNPNITSDNKGMAEFHLISYNGKTKKEYKIYILKNMPDFTFVEVAAHELMHIWIYENGLKHQEAALVEGSCNYASYLVLQELRTYNPYRMFNLLEKDTEYTLTKLDKNPDSIYGEGFRKIKRYVEKYGKFMWLSYLKHHKNLPRNF